MHQILNILEFLLLLLNGKRRGEGGGCGSGGWISLKHPLTNFKKLYAQKTPGCGTVKCFMRLGLDPTMDSLCSTGPPLQRQLTYASCLDTSILDSVLDVQHST